MTYVVYRPRHYTLLCALQSSDGASWPGPDGIQYPVVKYYWSDLATILTKTANEIMATERLPDCLKEVLITLIPKTGKAESLDNEDLRPILLSNTVLKLISKVAVRSIQKVAHVLIGPYQRGFMKDRRINQNTMELFTMLELIKKDREVSFCSDCQANKNHFTKVL